MSKPTPMSAHKAFHGKPFVQHAPVAMSVDKTEAKFPDTKFPTKGTKVVAASVAVKPKFGSPEWKAMYGKGKKV